jgi:hypothetical protein
MKKIISAKYGANDKYYDVYKILIKLINDRKIIQITNDFFGDPIFGTVKELIV